MSVLEIIRQITAEKQLARIHPACATEIEILERYEGMQDECVAEIEELLKTAKITQNRTINYYSFKIKEDETKRISRKSNELLHRE